MDGTDDHPIDDPPVPAGNVVHGWEDPHLPPQLKTNIKLQNEVERKY